jgi:hypothetical protein
LLISFLQIRIERLSSAIGVPTKGMTVERFYLLDLMRFMKNPTQKDDEWGCTSLNQKHEKSAGSVE